MVTGASLPPNLSHFSGPESWLGLVRTLVGILLQGKIT
jgi:hypothetical protein